MVKCSILGYMAETKIIVQSAEEMKTTGEILAKEALETLKKDDDALVFGLSGDLGSGKTTFVQGFAGGLGVKDKITSPTFVIFKRYLFSGGSFYHVDCYRVASGRDLAELGFKEIVGSKENVVLVEWAEKIRDVLPGNTIWMNFKYLDKDKREIHF